MNRLFVVVLLSLLSIARVAAADSGVVLESEGNVQLKLPSGKMLPATRGGKYPDGTTVVTGKDGKAVVVTEFGQMFRIGPNTTVKIGDRTGDTGAVSISQGLILALREGLGGPTGGPRAHAAVKGLGGNQLESKMSKQSLQRELKEVDHLPLDSGDAKAMLKGQIYYRYGEFQKTVEVLEPVYKVNAKAAFVKEMLAASHERLGELEKARMYR